MSGGSIYFSSSGSGGTYSTLVAPAHSLSMSTDDFTIEWFQYETDDNSFPRVFSIGNYPSAQIAVSLEGNETSRTFYFWYGGTSYYSPGTITITNPPTWTHFAITREGSSLRVFQDGTQIGTTGSNSADLSFSVGTYMTIGNESIKSQGAQFTGYITNMRWVAGTALYTSNFIPPVNPLTAVSGTSLLLLASSSATYTTDSSTNNLSVTGTNVSYSIETPLVSLETECLGPDTEILMWHGHKKKISEVEIGDVLITPYGSSSVTGVFTYQTNKESEYPFLIKKNLLGENIPNKDLVISPKHHILVGSQLFDSETLRQQGLQMEQITTEKIVKYYHLSVKNHSLINANGVWVEDRRDRVQK